MHPQFEMKRSVSARTILVYFFFLFFLKGVFIFNHDKQTQMLYLSHRFCLFWITDKSFQGDLLILVICLRMEISENGKIVLGFWPVLSLQDRKFHGDWNLYLLAAIQLNEACFECTCSFQAQVRRHLNMTSDYNRLLGMFSCCSNQDFFLVSRWGPYWEDARKNYCGSDRNSRFQNRRKLTVTIFVFANNIIGRWLLKTWKL